MVPTKGAISATASKGAVMVSPVRAGGTPKLAVSVGRIACGV